IKKDSPERKVAKSVNFGLIYGMSAPTLRSKVWDEADVDISLEEAEAFCATFFQMYPRIAQWHAALRRRIRQQGQIETRTLTGRRRLHITNYREAANTPVQGSAADGAKLALVYLDRDQQAMPEARVIAFIHDEFILEAPCAIAEDVKAWAVRH